MKFAGADQQGVINKVNTIRIILDCASFGSAPYYGEAPYSIRRIL